MKKSYLILAAGLLLTISSCDNKNKDDIRKGIYEGKDLSKEAVIIRDKSKKDATLSINVDGNWKLYAGQSPDAINYGDVIAEGTGKGSYPLAVNDSARTYFELVTDEGKAIFADTHLPMDGGYNFRDLGGIKTKDGRYVKWDKFIRSDELGHLTGKDLNYLESLPLKTVVDFRRPDEITKLPDLLPPSVTNYVELNITSANLKPGSSTIEDVRDWMIFINEELVTDTVIQNTYKEFFKLAQDEKNIPLLFHCSAGKDRTGMGAALILFALNVDEETIFKEHMLSNKYLVEKYKPIIEKNPELKPQFEVQEAYFKVAIDRIKKDHGSVENYLTNTLGVDIAKFREMYLY